MISTVFVRHYNAGIVIICKCFGAVFGFFQAEVIKFTINRAFGNIISSCRCFNCRFKRFGCDFLINPFDFCFITVADNFKHSSCAVICLSCVADVGCERILAVFHYINRRILTVIITVVFKCRLKVCYCCKVAVGVVIINIAAVLIAPTV